ncbi:DUF6232 family protein [Streptomyces globosus]|uniref:DUF6232 family protein n=1 Tax=Streptomyces globosus TaxID=68209 RepID=UPI0037FFAF10
MDTRGSGVPSQPSAPPRPTGPAAQPGGVPPVPQRPPGAAPAPAGKGRPLDLTVTRRLLWVGGAVYPLANIARVHTFVLRPRRKEAVLQWLRRTAVTLLAALGFTLFGAIAEALTRGESGFGGVLAFVWIAAVAALVWFAADMLAVVTASSHFTLGVETNGQSTALATGDPAQLDEAVHRIAYAIEHPDTELRLTVEQLSISNPSNYYFGDTVNMYGGNGNVGMRSA